jgi:ABC-type Fe3+/spermidine/putrescine transport system ATPase subunit
MGMRVSGIEFSYGKGPNVLDGLSFEVGPGQIAALLGRSGSGKTTVLNVIAGFLVPSKGSVSVDGRDIGSLPPGKREMGMVMQDLSLFPNMTALENVEYSLRARGMKKASARDRAAAMLDRMEMASMKDRSVRALSGGERQRVALARSLVYDPKVLLMDEPLSALDPTMREGLRREMKDILREQGVTTLYVTHDRHESLSIADRILIMDDGRIVEEGTPDEIYWQPRTRSGASFMGFCSIQTDEGHAVNFRPESVKMTRSVDSLEIDAIVIWSEYKGSYYQIGASSMNGDVIFHSKMDLKRGTSLPLYVPMNRMVILG